MGLKFLLLNIFPKFIKNNSTNVKIALTNFGEKDLFSNFANTKIKGLDGNQTVINTFKLFI